MNRLATAFAMLALGLAIPAYAQNQPKSAQPAQPKQKIVAPTKTVSAKSMTRIASSQKTPAKTGNVAEAKTTKKSPEGKTTKKQHAKAHARHSGKSSGKHKMAAKHAMKGAKAVTPSSTMRSVTKMRPSTSSKSIRSTVNRQ